MISHVVTRAVPALPPSLPPSPFFSMSVGKSKGWGIPPLAADQVASEHFWFFLSPLCPCASEQNAEHKLIPLCKPGAPACTSEEGATHASLAWTLLWSISHVTAVSFLDTANCSLCVCSLLSSPWALLSFKSSCQHLPSQGVVLVLTLAAAAALSVFPVLWATAKVWVKLLGSPVFSEGSVCQAPGSAA